MGLEPFNVSSALNLVLAQRLLRRICSGCKTVVTPDPLEFDAAKIGAETTLRDLRFTEQSIRDMIARAPKESAALLAAVTLDTKVRQMPYFRGRGCEACGGSGLKGRQGAYEVMFMTPSLRKLILQNVGAAEIRDAAIADGMLTLRMDGLIKVWKGITTLEQVVRETSA
jgi:type IV pilus assembly protein PilB